jgi:hypothetical protein
MNNQIIKAVRREVLLRLNKYRAKRWINYDGDESEEITYDDFTGEPEYDLIENDIVLSPVISVYIEAENLYRAEVVVGIDDLIDHFNFSFDGDRIIFEFDTIHPRDRWMFIECDDFFDMNQEIKDVNPELDNPSREKNDPEPVEKLLLQFSMDESEFRKFEKQKVNYLRKWKLEKIERG